MDSINLNTTDLRQSIWEQFLILSAQPEAQQGFVNTTRMGQLYKGIEGLNRRPDIVSQLLRCQGSYQNFEIVGLAATGLPLEERMHRVTHLTHELLRPFLDHLNPNCIPMELRLMIDHETTIRAVVSTQMIELQDTAQPTDSAD